MTFARPFMLVLGLVVIAGAAQARPMSDDQVRQQIIKESIQSHGGVCVCPYQRDPRDRRHHRQCGDRSMYNQPGGYPPECFARDINDNAVAAWRNEHTD